jgi:CRP-like cAMP-binding protein
MERVMAKFKTTAKTSDGPERGGHDSLEALRTHFTEGTIVFSEGDLGLTMYVIESGEVEISKRIGGESRVLATLEKGDFFGEMCMLEDEFPRSATAIAITDVDAVIIDQSAFTYILRHNPEIAVRMMRKLAVRLRRTNQLLENAGAQRVELDDSEVGRRPSATPDPSARLVEVGSGIVFPLADQKETTVGRIDPVTGINPEVDLTPVDAKRSTSRRHARIRREADGTYSVIEDVGTMNGTFVNGVRLTAGRGFPINPGDTVTFGTIQCRFEISDDA